MQLNNTDAYKLPSSDDNFIKIPIDDIKKMENHIIKEMLQLYKGDKRTIEQKLNMSSTTLWRRVKELQISENFIW